MLSEHFHLKYDSSSKVTNIKEKQDEENCWKMHLNNNFILLSDWNSMLRQAIIYFPNHYKGKSMYSKYTGTLLANWAQLGLN